MQAKFEPTAATILESNQEKNTLTELCYLLKELRYNEALSDEFQERDVSFYQRILTKINTLVPCVEDLRQNQPNSEILHYFFLIQVNCMTQIIKTMQLSSNSFNVAESEASLLNYSDLISKAIEHITNFGSYEANQSLDSIKSDWAANHWCIAKLYCCNELHKFYWDDQSFQFAFERGKLHFAKAQQFYVSIHNEQMKTNLLKGKAGNFIASAKTYQRIADDIFKLVNTDGYYQAKVVKSLPDAQERKALKDNKTVLFIVHEEKLHLTFYKNERYIQRSIDAPELVTFLSLYEDHQTIKEREHLLKINDFFSAVSQPKWAHNFFTPELQLDLLEKAIVLYEAGLSVFSKSVESKAHSMLLMKLCQSYQLKAALLEDNKPNPLIRALHEAIISCAKKIEENTRVVAYQTLWDHKLLAQYFLFKSYLYLFTQENNPSCSNPHLAKLLIIAEEFKSLHFSYGHGLSKDFLKPVWNEKQMAEGFLSEFGSLKKAIAAPEISEKGQKKEKHQASLLNTAPPIVASACKREKTAQASACQPPARSSDSAAASSAGKQSGQGEKRKLKLERGGFFAKRPLLSAAQSGTSYSNIKSKCMRKRKPQSSSSDVSLSIDGFQSGAVFFNQKEAAQAENKPSVVQSCTKVFPEVVQAGI